MYLLNKAEKTLEKIEATTFSEHNLKERSDLQEWIDKDPNILGEELLIIQKEFDGFDNTSERLDLLALDKKGNLVLIENKLDDSGKDVTWQALKYASYCSGMGKSDIEFICEKYLKSKRDDRNASEYISKFLEGTDISENNLNDSQRIILIAREFRQEVTNVVLWLRAKNIDIQCIKVTPYLWQDQILVDFDKIIPIQEAEEYMIRLSKKEAEKEAVNKINEYLYYEYWERLLDYCNGRGYGLFKNRTKSREHWLGTGSGISGISYHFVLLTYGIRVELYIDQGSSEMNKDIYDQLEVFKDTIEQKFGNALFWERLNDKRASRISFSCSDFSRDEKEKWNDAIKWHYEHMKRLEEAFNEPLQKIKR